MKALQKLISNSFSKNSLLFKFLKKSSQILKDKKKNIYSTFFNRQIYQPKKGYISLTLSFKHYKHLHKGKKKNCKIAKYVYQDVEFLLHSDPVPAPF